MTTRPTVTQRKRVKPIPKDQLWFYHPEMQERIARAEEDFAMGRSTTTTSPEEAQAFLDRLKRG